VDVARQRAAELLRRGVSQAETARQVGKNKSTVARWLKDPSFVALVQTSDFQAEAATGLADLVPKALDLLRRALEGETIPANHQAVALNIVKAAAANDPAGAAGGGELARRIQEMDGARSD
jgi:transcriptional regulator with XRE-family HTH domain